MNSPTDFLGRIITVDHTLVYPVRQGSRMWLNRITVTKADGDAVHGSNQKTGRMVKLTNLHNTIVVQPGEITPPIEV